MRPAAQHLLFTLWVAGCAVSPASNAKGASPSTVKDDEVIVLFPTWSAPTAAGAGAGRGLPIHGWIYEPEDDSVTRRAAISALRRVLGLSRDTEDSAVFKRRAALFLVDSERGKRVAIRLGDREVVLPKSEPDGHFEGTVTALPVELAALPRPPSDSGADIVRLETVASEDGRSVQGWVHLIGPSGLTVISDIDDTMKITNVRNRTKLIENTFVNEFKPVPGMAALYQAWARQGAVFHLVSSTPWQLYTELAEFTRSSGFPAATFHLKFFRVKDRTILDLFKSGEETKPGQIEPIMDAFPGRSFILMGDSGESDPEVYGAIFRKRSQQIRHIYIRNVTGERLDNARFRKAFEGVPAERTTLFEDPGILAP